MSSKIANKKSFIWISSFSKIRDYYIKLESLILGGIIMTDKTITCRDCGSEFIFSVGEQEFYKEKGFDNEPTRCISCRRAKKEQNRR